MMTTMLEGDELEKIAAVVAKASGIDFTKYRKAVLARRIEHRMTTLSVTSGKGYLRTVVEDETERVALTRALLVQTTQMFRDESIFWTLREQALPALFRRRAREGASAVRAWVTACATGEEAFSMAMCLEEAARPYPNIDVSVLATDVDPHALARARLGSIRPQSLVSVPAGFEPWFARRENDYAIATSITSRITWAVHDLLAPNAVVPREAVIASFDLVSCQNFLIYVDRSAQRDVYARLTKSIAPNGLLVLGRSECPVDRFEELVPVLASAPIFRLARP